MGARQMTANNQSNPKPNPTHSYILRVGIVGCGRVAEHHLRFIARSKKARLVGLADTKKECADQWGRRYGVANVHGSLEELLTSTKLDVLHVLTPPVTHYACAKAAVDHGLHVFVEKPVTFTAKELSALYDRANAKGVLLCP